MTDDRDRQLGLPRRQPASFRWICADVLRELWPSDGDERKFDESAAIARCMELYRQRGGSESYAGDVWKQQLQIIRVWLRSAGIGHPLPGDTVFDARTKTANIPSYALLNEADMLRAGFHEDMEIPTGGGRTTFLIEEIKSDRLVVVPTQSAGKYRHQIMYGSISAIVARIHDVNSDQIEKSVGAILASAGINDTKNETYLLGVARAYLSALPTTTEEELADKLQGQVDRSLQDSAIARQQRLVKAPKLPPKVLKTAVAYDRNPDVIAEVLHRAAGMCEGCLTPAPFARKKDGTPYLEVHHIRQLAEGGFDVVENAQALCPNCHRKRHFG